MNITEMVVKLSLTGAGHYVMLFMVLLSVVSVAVMLERLLAAYEITEIYHLAALLSTRGEFTPEAAHDVNVTGTLNLLSGDPS